MQSSKQLMAIIERHILLIRGEKVMLDAELAKLYGVETKVLLQAVKRNQARFPEDFMFQLNKEEFEHLRSQIVTSNEQGRGGRRYAPYAFTEQGVAMLSSVLRSQRAVAVNVEIMRTFVRLRRMLASNKQLQAKLEAMEQKYDEQFSVIFKVIKQLMQPDETNKKRPIGFAPWSAEEDAVESITPLFLSLEAPDATLVEQTLPNGDNYNRVSICIEN